jgi:hypothetical protein
MVKTTAALLVLEKTGPNRQMNAINHITSAIIVANNQDVGTIAGRSVTWKWISSIVGSNKAKSLENMILPAIKKMTATMAVCKPCLLFVSISFCYFILFVGCLKPINP